MTTHSVEHDPAPSSTGFDPAEVFATTLLWLVPAIAFVLAFLGLG